MNGWRRRRRPLRLEEPPRSDSGPRRALLFPSLRSISRSNTDSLLPPLLSRYLHPRLVLRIGARSRGTSTSFAIPFSCETVPPLMIDHRWHPRAALTYTLILRPSGHRPAGADPVVPPKNLEMYNSTTPCFLPVAQPGPALL